MQRWKTLAPVEDVAPRVCACGETWSAEWAFCARCGRPAAERRPARAGLTPLGIALAVVALLVGVFVGSRRGAVGVGGNAPDPSPADAEVARLRGLLAGAEQNAGRLQDRNNALRKQLTDRHEAVARQLAERNDALRKHLKDRNDAVRKQLDQRDASIGFLEQRTEAAEQEAAALDATLADAEAQLKAWLDAQRGAGRAPPVGRDEAGGAPSAPPAGDGADAFWERFDAEHPNVNGRAVWEESVRAAAEELGPDHPDLRDRAAALFDASLARAEAPDAAPESPR